MALSRPLPPSWPLLYGAVALTTMGTMLLHLSLFRVLCVVFDHQTAFLTISVALCGLGIGGLISNRIARMADGFHQKLGVCSLTSCALIFVALIAVLAQRNNIGSLELALICIATALPFTCAGVIVASVIAEAVERIHSVYCFALLGAAAGGLLLIPLLNWFGGPNTTLSVTVLFAAAAAILFNLAGVTSGRLTSVALGLAFTLLIALNIRYHFLDVRYANGRKLEREEWVHWNSFSRVALATDPRSGAGVIHIDNEVSLIPNSDWEHLSPDNRHTLLKDGPALPYILRPGAKTLVIGPGGGIDIARALASGSQDITAVEINPAIANTIMRNRFSKRSHDLYLRPGVRIVIEDAQSYIRRSTERFQVIQANSVNSPAGPFAPNEDPLYTLDAFRSYFTHLSDDGMLAFTHPETDASRLFTLAGAVLQSLGEFQSQQHFLIARSATQRAVIIGRKPLRTADRDRAHSALGDDGRSAADLSVWRSQLSGRAEPPVSHPFWKEPLVRLGSSLGAPFFLLVAEALTLLVLLAWISRTHSHEHAGFFLTLAYFILIGAGGMLIAAALIQTFAVFLGHPTDTITAIVLPLLGFSALGSSFSRALIRGEKRRLIIALAAIALFVFLLASFLPLILESAAGFPHTLQVAVTISLICPAGFAVGLPFPSALEHLESAEQPWLRSVWSLYVLAAVFASFIAHFQPPFRLDAVLIGGVLFLCALLALAVSRSHTRSGNAAAWRD